MKVSPGVYNVIFTVCISVIMAAMMSMVMTLVNVGVVEGFWGIWLSSALFGCLVAIPVTFVTIPLVQRMLSFIEVE